MSDIATPELPDKMRVHALARLLGRTSREVLAALAALDIAARSPQSSIDRKAAELVVSALQGDAAPGAPVEEPAPAEEPAPVEEPAAVDAAPVDAPAPRTRRRRATRAAAPAGAAPVETAPAAPSAPAEAAAPTAAAPTAAAPAAATAAEPVSDLAAAVAAAGAV
ncbi:translation initiation factor IF-2 N-terminal domain-containing protein, partial [Pseudonocardia abyssalis]|uniref:translation initiation factor IF-2 N-terminal domain-containing protein n=1 Tax=Pseudonocardia abyssalis TaxID=2792008 RepID=UPI001C4A5AFD